MQKTEHSRVRYQKHPLHYIVSAPFIYSLIVPFLLLDLFVTIYHNICFPLYGLPLIKREEYIRVSDRLRLTYLSPIERINCAYCGYGNGLLHYVSAIAAATERHFCNIRHEDRVKFHPPVHHRDFTPYGDAAAYSSATGRKNSNEADEPLTQK
jgi:hypothetical protein